MSKQVKKRVTHKQLHQEVVRVFGEHTDEPIYWVVGPYCTEGVLVIAPGGSEPDLEMSFTAYPDRAAAKALAYATLQRMR